jgi:membrane protease YdiL (CAAX protease family)
MVNIFINAGEKRWRAGWRLLVFAMMNWSMVFIIGMGVGVTALASGVDFSNPQALQDSILYNQPALGALFRLVSTALIFLLAARVDRRSLADFGFHFNPIWWRDFGFGLLLGAGLMAFIFVTELAAGWVTINAALLSRVQGQSFWAGLGLSLLLFFCVGIYEEMLARAYQLRNLAEGLRGKYLNPKLAILAAYMISSAYFGYLHAGNPNASLLSTVFIMLAGLFLGLGFILTGELAIPIGLHMSWNFFQGSVFGFPVSGLNSAASFIGIHQAGPELFTGGAFGPEAGLVGLAALALGSVLIVLWLRWTRGAAQLEQRLAVFNPPAPRPVKAPDEAQQPVSRPE